MFKAKNVSVWNDQGRALEGLCAVVEKLRCVLSSGKKNIKKSARLVYFSFTIKGVYITTRICGRYNTSAAVKICFHSWLDIVILLL